MGGKPREKSEGEAMSDGGRGSVCESVKSAIAWRKTEKKDIFGRVILFLQGFEFPKAKAKSCSGIGALMNRER